MNSFNNWLNTSPVATWIMIALCIGMVVFILANLADCIRQAVEYDAKLRAREWYSHSPEWRRKHRAEFELW